MMIMVVDHDLYQHIRNGGAGFYHQRRGLIAVWGGEAVQFLDGMVTNDIKTLSDGGEMLAAFPNAQGRLLAVVRILRQGDRFLIETEEATREKVFQNLFRFTFAGDFFVEDIAEKYVCFDVFNSAGLVDIVDSIGFSEMIGNYFVPRESADEFRSQLISRSAKQVTDEVYDVLRIEHGIPKYGVDMDETTVVPELGLDGLISYSKGCYIGQEIIARIHFRGHVAKRLTGIVEEPTANGVNRLEPGGELVDTGGKNAGKVTSVAFSPKLERYIALAFVRYEYLIEGTELYTGGSKGRVTRLPFA